MAQQLSAREINCLRSLSSHFDPRQLYSRASHSLSSAVDVDSTPALVRGDLARTLAAASGILGLILLGIISLVSLLMFLMWLCGPPSDKTLLTEFNSHRSELDTLARMSQQDADGIKITDNFKKLEIDWGWARPKSKRGMTLERWTEYRQLFRELDLTGFDKDKLGNVYFIAFAADLAPGGATSGASKGFVHCINAGGREQMFFPCLERVDRGHFEAASDRGYSYRDLGQNWYLFETWATETSTRAARD